MQQLVHPHLDAEALTQPPLEISLRSTSEIIPNHVQNEYREVPPGLTALRVGMVNVNRWGSSSLVGHHAL